MFVPSLSHFSLLLTANMRHQQLLTAIQRYYHARRKSVRSNSWGPKPDTDTDT